MSIGITPIHKSMVFHSRVGSQLHVWLPFLVTAGSPVMGPSQYTCMYSSKLFPVQGKVTAEARAGLKKAPVKGAAVG